MTLAPPRALRPTAERSLGRELVSPRSLGLLALALLIAALFGALGQWQLQRAVQNGSTAPRTTERARPLTDVARPGALQRDASVGQLVTVSGRFVPEDHLVVADRLNGGRTGAWVTGHLLTENGGQLAVALGWAPNEQTARAAARRLDAFPLPSGTITGRYLDSDAAEAPSSGPVGRLTAMSVPVLLNRWRPDAASGLAYVGYLTLRHAPSGLTTIDSPTPSAQRQLNLLNLLYAGEWGIFGVLALYVWYRLIRDRWELAKRNGHAAGPPDEDGPDLAGTAGRSTGA